MQGAIAAHAEIPAPAGEEIGVAEHTAFGQAGGAGGVEQGGFIRRGTGRVRGGGRGVVRADDRNIGQRRAAGGSIDREGDFRVGDEVVQFRRAQVRVDRHDGNAEPVEREEMQQHGRPVFQPQADAMAGAVAGGTVARHQRIHRRACLGVGDFAGQNAIDGGGFRQHRHERAVGILRHGGAELCVNGAGHHMNNWMLPKALSGFTRSIRFS